MKSDRYYCEALNQYAVMYKIPHREYCHKCGKLVNEPTAFVFEDDPDGLEHIYGSDCIKMFKFKKVR